MTAPTSAAVAALVERLERKFRVHHWFDTKRMQHRFGVQALIGGRWHHCSENGAPMLFDTEKEARTRIAALRSRAAQEQQG